MGTRKSRIWAAISTIHKSLEMPRKRWYPRPGDRSNLASKILTFLDTRQKIGSNIFFPIFFFSSFRIEIFENVGNIRV